MSEVTFAKQYLATLDKRPIKLSADHVSDPKKHPSQSPVFLSDFILPKQTHPYPRRIVPDGSSNSKTQTVTVTVKPMRSDETFAITDLTLDSTIHDVKTKFAQQTSLLPEKIKLMYNKKPAADLKTLKELGASGINVEISAMIMGGGTPAPSAAKSDPAPSIPAASDPMDLDSKASGPDSEAAQAQAASTTPSTSSESSEILKTDEFWADLSGFLVQRLRDEKEGQRLAGVFREAFKKA